MIYILPDYFYVVHFIYWFYLNKINLFISIPYPNQVYDKQRKKHFSVVICVCCAMSCSEIFLSQDGVFQRSMGSTKKKFLLPKMVETFGKHLSNFPILRKQSTVLIFWLTPCLNMIWGVWVHFPKMPQYMSTCETGITQPTEGLDTWVRSHLMWNKEQNTLDSVQCVPAHDLGYLRPVSSNFPNICYLFNRDNPTYREPWHLSRSHLM